MHRSEFSFSALRLCNCNLFHGCALVVLAFLTCNSPLPAWADCANTGDCQYVPNGTTATVIPAYQGQSYYPDCEMVTDSCGLDIMVPFVNEDEWAGTYGFVTQHESCAVLAPCNPDWVVSYGACSVPCGGGVQTPTYYCQLNGVTVANSICTQAGLPTPGPLSCNTQACAVNGACGSDNGQTYSSAPWSAAPGGLCSVGGATNGQGSGPWAWTCTGSSGGSNASCWANTDVVNGACGADNGQSYSVPPWSSAPGGLCNAGPADNAAGNGWSTDWSWTCNGQYGGTTQSCYAGLNGQCNPTDNGQQLSSAPSNPPDMCSYGSTSAVTDTGTQWTWQCIGNSGGGTDNCAANKATTSCTLTLPNGTDGGDYWTGSLPQDITITAYTIVGGGGGGAGAAFYEAGGGTGCIFNCSGPSIVRGGAGGAGGATGIQTSQVSGGWWATAGGGAGGTSTDATGNSGQNGSTVSNAGVPYTIAAGQMFGIVVGGGGGGGGASGDGPAGGFGGGGQGTSAGSNGNAGDFYGGGGNGINGGAGVQLSTGDMLQALGYYSVTYAPVVGAGGGGGAYGAGGGGGSGTMFEAGLGSYPNSDSYYCIVDTSGSYAYDCDIGGQSGNGGNNGQGGQPALVSVSYSVGSATFTELAGGGGSAVSSSGGAGNGGAGGAEGGGAGGQTVTSGGGYGGNGGYASITYTATSCFLQ